MYLLKKGNSLFVVKLLQVFPEIDKKLLGMKNQEARFEYKIEFFRKILRSSTKELLPR